MDTNNLQQSNNFADGMNTDTSDAFLSESSYRLANNLRYITNEQENSGELHMIEGAKYNCSFGTEKIIATTNLRDIPIYITQTAEKDHWKVYYDSNNCVANIAAEEDRVIDKKLSLVTRYEDADNQHLYIADGQGPVIIIQLSNTDQIPQTLNQVISYPAVLFNKPIFCGLVDGNLKASVVSYSYQFYKKHGQCSEISPSTKLIPLIKSNTEYKSSGYLSEETTDKGVKIRINIPDGALNTFDKIKIYRISYIETGQLPTIECIYDENLPVENETYIEYSDKGAISQSVLSLEEYNSMTGIHIIPKIIESKDDYLFAANIKDESTGYTVDWDATQNVTINLVTVDLIGDYNISPDEILKISGGSLNSTISTSSNDVFDLTPYIQTTNDSITYKNPQVSYMFKSLRRGETYRFGIILYDKYGKSSGVKFICDKKIENVSKMFEIQDDHLIVKPVGVKVTVSNLPEDTVAYEIVRCGRSISDVQTIAQGILSRPVSREWTGGNKLKQQYPLTPTGLISMHDTIWGIWHTLNDELGCLSLNVKDIYVDSSRPDDKSIGNYNIFQFISPEVCYLEDTIKDSTKNLEFELEPIDYVYPVLSTQHKNHVLINSSDDAQGNAGNNAGTNVFNYGNEYANVIEKYKPSTSQKPIELPGTQNANGQLLLSGGIGEIMTDYIKIENSSPISVSFRGRKDFSENYYSTNKRYSYAKLYNSDSSDLPQTTAITSISYPETLGWDDFATSAAENYTLKYIDKVCAVGGRNFINWVCGPMYNVTDKETSENIHIDTNTLDDGTIDEISVMGPGGKCIVISTENKDFADISMFKANSEDQSIIEKSYIGGYLCNLKKKVAIDESDVSKKFSTYRSFGDYFIKESASETRIVFDGDCFIQPFEYIAQHKFAHSSSRYFRTACKIFVFPVETSINLAYTSGYEFHNEFSRSSGDITFIQNNAGNVNNLFIQDSPLYSYNSVYSTIDTSKSYSSYDIINENDYDLTDTRVFHSNVKTNNEYVDNWLKYMPANFLDVDTRQGPITGLRTFKNQLIFWQEHSTGMLSVNERSVISDDSNMPLILGSGGVLTRFDYITNTNGMCENDYSDAQSNTTLYWWDRINKSICGYSGGQDAIELSKIKFVQNYLNKNEPIDDPVVAYDNKTKEVVANVVKGRDKESGSLIYNEHLGHFTSLYTINPKHKVELPNGILFTTDNSVYQWNCLESRGVLGLEQEALLPYLKHVVNHAGSYTKVFDNAEFAGRVYGGNDLSPLKLTFSTPLKQKGELKGSDIENREYNFKYIIPRNGDADHQPLYGDRLRGKTMQCELESSNNSYDFSLQYINTKFRVSWS